MPLAGSVTGPTTQAPKLPSICGLSAVHFPAHGSSKVVRCQAHGSAGLRRHRAYVGLS